MATGASWPLTELTLRGITFGGIIALMFTAANVYPGLKVGLTFATPIPAAITGLGGILGVEGGRGLSVFEVSS